MVSVLRKLSVAEFAVLLHKVPLCITCYMYVHMYVYVHTYMYVYIENIIKTNKTYTNIKSLCYTPEVNIMFYVHYT